MAKVSAPSRHDIEYQLHLVGLNWKEIDAVRPTWPDLHPVEKEAYHLEWFTFAEWPLRDLYRWRDDGLLNADELARLERLRPLIERNRDFLDQVFAEK